MRDPGNANSQTLRRSSYGRLGNGWKVNVDIIGQYISKVDERICIYREWLEKS